MRWDQGHDSPDVQDNRGQGGGGLGGLGGLIGILPFLLRSPIGWVILILGVGFYFCSGALSGTHGLHSGGKGGTQATDEQKHFVAFVLDDTQATWTKTFQARGATYRHAKLVLFTDSINTGCGYGQSATGPFYCPNDEKVYIDLGFFQELEGQLGAKGDFAKAYVIAHEIGHHVQKQLGVSDKVGEQPSKGETGSSVRLELQADCFAGVWAHSTGERNILENGDIDSALSATKAIGDDRLQQMENGTVSPEKWTHGSSAERTRWFTRGYDKGTIEACDTFGASSL